MIFFHGRRGYLLYTKTKDYLFSIDVETDGLYGETFAVGVSVWEK